ncbi:CCCP-1 [Trichostrongylus colubriformis]|uniref:CCCP-1 n=1 Tax=Trichostrongylus colubriformis TaxID=6319 RepID=A0AAN8F4W6_TRICO
MENCSSEIVSANGASSHSRTTSTETSPQKAFTSDDECTSLQSLYEKYTIQQKEIERLEEQNAEYREKLLRSIRERDLNEELLRDVREAQKKEASEFERLIHDYEVQLKADQERAAAQETQHSVTIKEISQKYNTSIIQLTKKADIAEKEKNDAVIKYATREAEIMRMRNEIQKKEHELRECVKAKEELQRSQDQENIEQLEKASNILRVELEQVKHEKFELERKLKMSEKRAEAYNTSALELKQQNDVLRKQHIQMKEEKNQIQEENRQLLAKTQLQESRRMHESEELSRSQQDMEHRLTEANAQCARLSDANRKVNTRLEDVTRENLDLMNKLQDLEDKLTLEEEAHAAASIEIDRLQSIERQVLGSQIQAERAKDAQEQAEKERAIAENEAEECRQQAERMLAITEQLTERNSQLAGDVATEREKNCRLEQQLVEANGSLTRALLKLAEREKDLEEATGSGQTEIASLKSELNERIVKVQQLTQRLHEERTDNAALKKKYMANIKELKHELSSLRKQVDSNSAHAPLAPPQSSDSVPSTSSRSRASSLNSLDRITTVSRDEDSTQSAHASTESNAIQQVMIDKIIILQRRLARRNDKIEFLEEHVRHCLEELQKKTKIIQHYALREEASLLLPSDGSLDKLMECCEVIQVPLSRKSASYSLMGSIFTAGSDKRSLQLSTEVNSRLQAVLEDVMIKNIALKSSVDSLSNEVSRLSRENRQLTLAHSRCAEQRS